MCAIIVSLPADDIGFIGHVGVQYIQVRIIVSAEIVDEPIGNVATGPSWCHFPLLGSFVRR